MKLLTLGLHEPSLGRTRIARITLAMVAASVSPTKGYLPWNLCVCVCVCELGIQKSQCSLHDESDYSYCPGEPVFRGTKSQQKSIIHVPYQISAAGVSGSCWKTSGGRKW